MSIEVHIDEKVAVVRLKRPDKLNALSLAMYEDLGHAFHELNENEAVRAVVLTGAGSRAFCVGADLLESIPALASGHFDISAWNPAHLKKVAFWKPIICAIRGLCIGGGFELMLGTDIRIASQDASFQLPEPKHGFVPAGGTLVRLARQISYAHAMEILLTARRFSAADMLTRGVINKVVPSDEVEPTALALAHDIAGFSAGAIQTIKEAVLTLEDLPKDEAFAAEARLGQRTFMSDDARLGLAAFAARSKEKRDDHG